MNKVEIGLLIALVGVFLYIGGLLYYEMVTEIENNPDIKEFGGPSVDLRLMVVMVVVVAIVCGIALWVKPKEEKKESKGEK